MKAVLIPLALAVVAGARVWARCKLIHYNHLNNAIWLDQGK